MATQLLSLPQCCMQNKPINMNTEDITSSIGKGSYDHHQIKEIAHQSQQYTKI
jgi:hypothetical protein